MKELTFTKGKVLIQTMLDFAPRYYKKAIRKIKKLEELGCDLVRVSVVNNCDILGIKKICKKIKIPLVTDIHFDYRLAILSLDAGASKIRINPSNIKLEHLEKIITKATEKNAWIRIGVNLGSIKARDSEQFLLMFNELEKALLVFKKYNFSKIVVSLKASEIDTAIKASEMYFKKYEFPFHAGLTESGTMIPGIVKSVIYFEKLFNISLPETIRFSLSLDPEEEVKVAYAFLKAKKLVQGPEIISCPMCGRKTYNVKKLALYIEKKLNKKITKNVRIAVMGCIVNGLGEAKDSDYAIIKVKKKAILYKEGKSFFQGSIKKCVKFLIKILQ